MLPSGAASGEGYMKDVSLAQLQEMRERSKVLREQVLQVQRTVQTKVGFLNVLKIGAKGSSRNEICDESAHRQKHFYVQVNK